MELKNKEIQNKQKLIDILQKDNLKLKNQMEKINNSGIEENENKIMDDLIKKNKEITEMEAKIRDFKIKVEEHNKCDSAIENLNRLIENNKRELEKKSTHVAEQQKKNLELSTKLTMADKALKQFEENRSRKNKLSKKKNNRLYLPNINTEGNKSQLINNNVNKQKYLNTQQNTNINKKMLNKNPKNAQKNLTTNTSNNTKNTHSPKKNFKDLTKEEKGNLLNVFTEEEIGFIQKAVNNDQKRFNVIMEKLFILDKYRYSKEKILKGNIKENKQKLNKSIESLKSLKNEYNEKEFKMNELNNDIKKLEQSNAKLKENINLLMII